MIAKGKSISHGTAALEYDLSKQIAGKDAATEVCRNGLYGTTGADMVQEMKPYFADFPNVRNNCLRFEVSPSIEESAQYTSEDWRKLADDFLTRMGLQNHQYVVIRHSGTESRKNQAHLHIGKPGFHVRRALPGQLDRQEGDRSSQRHGEGEESRTGSGYRQGKQTGHQVRHGRSSSEAREVRLRQFQGGNGESWISYP